MFVIFLLHRGYVSVAIAAFFFRGYHHIICHPLLEKGVPCVYYSLWPRREKNSLTFSYIKSECPGQPRGGGRGFKWLDWCSDPFFKSCKNDKRNSDLFFKVMRKRETKFKSVFQSNAKRKNENWNWYPFFKVMRKRKTKYEVQNHFSKLGENEKQNSNLFINVMGKRKMDMALEFLFPMPSENGWR